MKNKLFAYLAFIGASVLAVWMMMREKKSGIITTDLFGGGQGAANSLQFTMTNRSDTAQKINLFNATSLTSIYNQNPNIQITSTPDLQYFIQTLQKEPKALDRVDIRSDNQQQLMQTFNVQAKDANGKQINVPVLPMQSAMQVQPNFATADLNGVILDITTRIRAYTVLPKTTVTMILYWK